MVSAVRNGRVASAHWGYHMLAKRGGLAMAAHGAYILARSQMLKACTRRQSPPQTPYEAWHREAPGQAPGQSSGQGEGEKVDPRASWGQKRGMPCRCGRVPGMRD